MKDRVKKKIFWYTVLLAVFIGEVFSKAYNSDDAPPSVPFAAFYENGTGTVKASGWLLEFLNRQRSGLTGHPDVLSYPYNTSLWAGTIDRIGETHGDNWWRYEQTAYYTDGLLRLGYLLGDRAMINKAKAGIDYTLAQARTDGRIGQAGGTSQWPVAVFFRVMQAQYLVNHDSRIIQALQRHYLSYTAEELGKHNRAIINIEGALWTYGYTHNKQLLKLSEKAYALGGFDMNMDSCLSNKGMHTHGVSYMEMAKLPAILYSYTGKQIYLKAALNAMKKLDRDNMLPDGVPRSNEHLGDKDPIQSHETCDITDYTWAAGYLLMITGDATWADRIEKAVFNAGPGAVSKDFKNLQYFSSVNQVIATGNSNSNAHAYGSSWMAYWPCHETECCAGNVHRFMPNYVARMWMRGQNNAPVAALYGPCSEQVSYKGQVFRITETTAYPFDEQISFNFELQRPLKMPFSFRIPSWCGTPQVKINGKLLKISLPKGKFVTLDRVWRKTDLLTLHLPMTPFLVDKGKWGASIERGPLLYAYAVPEKVRVDTATYASLNGKRSADPRFPALDIRPAGTWNYALSINSAPLSSQIKVVKTGLKGYPFDPGNSPLIISVAAKRVKNWKLREGRFTPALPAPGSFQFDQEQESISLVPYGSTRLRMSAFPLTYKINK